MIKLYYDNVADALEMVLPDGTVYWSWSDEVAGTTGFQKAGSDDITAVNAFGWDERFEYMGEIE